MAVFDDGSGGALYIGGSFESVDNVAGTYRIAKWDGQSWSAIPGVIYGGPFNYGVSALEVHDDGTGPALYVGGRIGLAGIGLYEGVARWDGVSWTLCNTGSPVPDQGVFDLQSHGGALFATGTVQAGGVGPCAGGDYILTRWDGASWSCVAACRARTGHGGMASVGGWLFTAAQNLCAGCIPEPTCQDYSGVIGWSGSGWIRTGLYQTRSPTLVNNSDSRVPLLGWQGRLYCASALSTHPTQSVIVWNGALTWSPAGNALDGSRIVHALETFDDGGGGALYACGDFTGAGGNPSVAGIGKLVSGVWQPLDGGVGQGCGPRTIPRTMKSFTDSRGRGLYVAGIGLNCAGGAPAQGIARWYIADACYADCDPSPTPGVLDIFDFLCFQNRYAQNDPYACDCDTSTGQAVCDIFDFLCFQNAFANGCP